MPTFTLVIIVELQQECLNFFFYVSLFEIAIATINRTPFNRIEGDLGFNAAIGAIHGMHLSRTSIPAATPPTGFPAIRASAWIVLQTVRSIKFLLPYCKFETFLAIPTA
jgi:hypothetical protein